MSVNTGAAFKPHQRKNGLIYLSHVIRWLSTGVLSTMTVEIQRQIKKKKAPKSDLKEVFTL